MASAALLQSRSKPGDGLIRGLDLFEPGALRVDVRLDGGHQLLVSHVVAE